MSDEENIKLHPESPEDKLKIALRGRALGSALYNLATVDQDTAEYCDTSAVEAEQKPLLPYSTDNELFTYTQENGIDFDSIRAEVENLISSTDDVIKLYRSLPNIFKQNLFIADAALKREPRVYFLFPEKTLKRAKDVRAMICGILRKPENLDELKSSFDEYEVAHSLRKFKNWLEFAADGSRLEAIHAANISSGDFDVLSPKNLMQRIENLARAKGGGVTVAKMEFIDINQAPFPIGKSMFIDPPEAGGKLWWLKSLQTIHDIRKVTSQMEKGAAALRQLIFVHIKPEDQIVACEVQDKKQQIDNVLS